MIDTNEQALNLWDQHTQDFLASQGWDGSGSLWLLAVSGGADSTALLHWARRAAPRVGASIAVAHVNHGLRPGASAEAEFVAGLCRRFGIPFFSCNLDPTLRLPRESVEMWARRERYAFFDAAGSAAAACEKAAEGDAVSAKASVSVNADTSPTADSSGAWILTAHHRDDLVETVFQRLGRGTGPRGLKGIPFRRGRIVRPFLNRPRTGILAYLDLLGALWREDESNADTGIDRNWYRHRFLPLLRNREPDLDARILTMALVVQALDRQGKGIDALEEQEGLLRSDGIGPPYLDLEGFAGKAEASDLEALDFWVRRLVESSPGAGNRPIQVTNEILREVCRQWKTGPNSLQVPLNARLALKRVKQGICCVETAFRPPRGRGEAKKSCPPPVQRVILDKGSIHALGPSRHSWRWGERLYSLSARRFPRPLSLEFPPQTGERAIFDADLFSCTLLIRTRKSGDRFSPLGIRSRTRKLKTFFNEEKVPIGMRDNLPIIVAGEDLSPDDGTPAWVPGLGISDFFKVSGSTSHILELVLTCQNP